MYSFAWLVDTVLWLCMWVVIAHAIISMLVSFNVVNTRNRLVFLVGSWLSRVTQPALRPIRRIVPIVGGLDLSPLVLILLIAFLRMLLREYVY